MLIDGNPQDQAKAIEWVRQQKNAALRERQKFKIQDGKLFHGYSEDVSHNLNMCGLRREINNSKATGEIAALASFSKVAIRMYAARIGVSTARMYREPALMQRMIKDPDYRRFHLVDGAHKML